MVLDSGLPFRLHRKVRLLHSLVPRTHSQFLFNTQGFDGTTTACFCMDCAELSQGGYRQFTGCEFGKLHLEEKGDNNR
jgi:hypothetical protein